MIKISVGSSLCDRRGGAMKQTKTKDKSITFIKK